MRKSFILLALLGAFLYLSLPVRADGDLDAGKALFHKNCTACHGVHGDGKGPAASSLTPPPANFTDGKFMGSQKDADLSTFIKNGKPGSAMVGWKDKFSDDQIRQLVSYIRTLSH